MVKVYNLPCGKSMRCFTIGELAKYCGLPTEVLKKRIQRCGFQYSSLFKIGLYYKMINGEKIIIKGCTEWAAIRIKALIKKIETEGDFKSGDEFKKWVSTIFACEAAIHTQAQEPDPRYNRDYYSNKEILDSYLEL